MKISAWTLAALLTLAGCAQVGERIELDRRALVEDVRERTGENLAPTAKEIESARALLESPLDMEAAVRVALALDPGLRERIAELGLASAQRVSATRVSNPLAQMSLVFFDGATELEGSFTQSLLDLITLSARREAAAARFDAERSRTAHDVVRAIHDVRRAWVDARIAQSRLALAREANAAEEAADDLAEALFAAGNWTPAARSASAASAARSRIELEEAQEQHDAARERLAVRLGLAEGLGERALADDVDALTPSFASFALPSVGESEARAFEASLELAESRSMVAELAARAGVAGWDALMQNASAGVAVRRDDGRSAVGPTISLPIPLLDDGSPARAAAAQALEAAIARHDALAIEVLADARALRARLETSLRRAAAARNELVPSAREHVAAVLTQFNAMQIGVFDVLEARREEFDASHAELDALHDAWTARVDFDERLAGAGTADERDGSAF